VDLELKNYAVYMTFSLTGRNAKAKSSESPPKASVVLDDFNLTNPSKMM